jgi:hypothetical protein
MARLVEFPLQVCGACGAIMPLLDGACALSRCPKTTLKVGNADELRGAIGGVKAGGDG